MQAFLNSAGDDLIDLAADKMVAGTNYFAASATPAVEALAFVFKMFVHANSKMLETNAQVAAQAKANYNSNLSNIISNNAMFTGDQISMSMIIGNNGVPHYKWSWDENTLNKAINAYSNIHPENQITMERFKNAMDTEPDKVLNYQIKAGTEHDLQTPPKNKYGKFLWCIGGMFLMVIVWFTGGASVLRERFLIMNMSSIVIVPMKSWNLFLIQGKGSNG